MTEFEDMNDPARRKKMTPEQGDTLLMVTTIGSSLLTVILSLSTLS